MLSIESLEAALPGLITHRLPVRRRVDWETVCGRLGTSLPGDYIDLAELYPWLKINQFLAVTSPVPGAEGAFVEQMRENLGALDEMSQQDMSGGYPAFPTPGGLFPWGSSVDGDEFHWVTKGEPDRWTVVVAGANDDWYHHNGGITDYLAGLCVGTVPPYGLPSGFPGSNPTVSVG